MSGAKIETADFMLVVQGWVGAERDIRVVLESPDVTFALSGKAFIAVPETLEFTVSLGEMDMVGLSIAKCECGFLDLQPGETVMGRIVESGLVAVRPDFSIIVMLFAE